MNISSREQSHTSEEDLEVIQTFPSEKTYEIIIGFELGGKLSDEKVRSYLTVPYHASEIINEIGNKTLNGYNNTAELIKETPVASIIKKPEKPNFFSSLQKWEGTVVDIEDDYFSARLVDLTNKGPDESAEFSVDEVSPDDLELLERGAIFYWNIGYHNSRSGQRTRSSIIRFRRLPAWIEKDLEKAEKEAEKLLSMIKVE